MTGTRITAALCGLFLSTVALSTVRIEDWAFADHFTRYYCISKYPEMRTEIQRAYDSSVFRFIQISCRGLRCSDPEQTRGMQILLARAKQFSDAENRETCSSYSDSLRDVESQFSPELLAHYPKSGKARSPMATHN
jgi:hypothetical protein